jgi:hypothetical protein
MMSQRWQRIETVYQGALQRHAGQREAFLREECREDDALRREVESLLANQSKAAAFLSGRSAACCMKC